MSLEKVEEHIPFIGTLLKKEQDVDALVQYDSKGGRYPKNWQELGPRYNEFGRLRRADRCRHDATYVRFVDGHRSSRASA